MVEIMFAFSLSILFFFFGEEREGIAPL